MNNDDPEPPKAVVQATQGPGEPSPRIYKEDDTAMNQLQPSNSPETPTPPLGHTLVASRAPEPMSLHERHQSALHHIHTLESHNARLYEDNCRLVNAVNMLNDRLAFFGAPQNVQLHRLADMQEKLRASEASRALIHQKHQELLQCNSAAFAQHHLYGELQAAREAHTLLERDYRLLADKYAKLKAVASVTDPNRVAQQQSQGTARGFIRSEVVNTQFHAQNRNNLASPTSAISPSSFQFVVDQNGPHQRRNSESVLVQPSLRSAPTPIATSWLANLPTPPPSAPLPMGQISPKSFPVHASMPAASLALPHHPQVPHDPRTLSGLPTMTQSQHSVQQSTSELLTTAMPHRRRSRESTDTPNREPVPCSKGIPAHAPLTSSPRALKRPSTELQTSVNPKGEHKKARIGGDADRPTTIDARPHPANTIPASTDSHSDPKSGAPDSIVLRSYQDCVNLIFEKDADVENGVFCGLCLDRHEAKMIPEPPDVLIQPDFDFLVRHCMTEHPIVWEDLRHNKA